VTKRMNRNKNKHSVLKQKQQRKSSAKTLARKIKIPEQT